ncbi:MAG: HepT-like ribonuclease domain-containing protein [Flavonifractor plautii]
MRNLVAHSYGSMSRDIIWETVVTDIPSFRSL